MLGVGKHVLVDPLAVNPAADKHVFALTASVWPASGEVLRLAVEFRAAGEDWRESAHYVFSGVDPADPNPKLRQWPADATIELNCGAAGRANEQVRVTAQVLQPCEISVAYVPRPVS